MYNYENFSGIAAGYSVDRIPGSGEERGETDVLAG